MVRITLMYYIDVMGFLEHPEKDWEVALEQAVASPPGWCPAEKGGLENVVIIKTAVE